MTDHAPCPSALVRFLLFAECNGDRFPSIGCAPHGNRNALLKDSVVPEQSVWNDFCPNCHRQEADQAQRGESYGRSNPVTELIHSDVPCVLQWLAHRCRW